MEGWGGAQISLSRTIAASGDQSVSLSPQTTDDIVSSAECSSDDEDLEECDSGHAGGMGVWSCACAQRSGFPCILSLICHEEPLLQHHVPWQLQV